MGDWAGPDGELGRFIEEQTATCLEVYAKDRTRIEEDATIEVTAAEGGYGRRQIFELVQNATDALRDDPGPIHVILTDRDLYVANAGVPFSRRGAQSLLASHLSRKTDDEIGQFGLGFKSVTGISDQVTILSRTASFVFERTWSDSVIRKAGFSSPRYPMLRLARVIDPAQEAESDKIVSELMTWAATIVRVSLRSGRGAELAEDIKEFRGPFLLFSPAVTHMRLEDRTGHVSRTLRRQESQDQVVLTDNDRPSHWIVVKSTTVPSGEARRDAGQLMKRESIEVAWAAPVSGARGVGEFWAYFPTDIRTTLSGIVNAPWKLSADRRSMIEGTYNRELLTEVLPHLVAEGIRRLPRPEDPASHLDALPARGKESRSWADGIINEPIYNTLARKPCLPDGDGGLREPKSLKLHPPGLPQAWKGAWWNPHPEEWVHHSVDRTPERRSKAERLITIGGGGTVDLTRWLEAVVEDRSPAASGRALALAAIVLSADRNFAVDVRKARIVLLEDGELARPERGRVFVRSGEGGSSDHDFIHPELAQDKAAVEALAALGIEVLNPAGELRAALKARPSGVMWGKVWHLARQVDVEQALVILDEELPAPLNRSVYAQMKTGRWRRLAECFLAGDVIPREATRDADHLIDPIFHAPDQALLERCGAVSSPRLVGGLPDEPWLAAFRQRQIERYRQGIQGPQPPPDKVTVTGPPVPRPLELMSLLSIHGRAAMTRAILDLACYDRWKVLHSSNSHFPVKSISNPAAARIAEYGALPTTIGPAVHAICLHPLSDLPDCFPKAEVSSAWAEALRLPMDCSAWTPEGWEGFIKDAELRRPGDVAVVYATAAKHGVPAPKPLLAFRTATTTLRADPGDVAVTEDPETYASLLLAGIPSLHADSVENRAQLVEKWRLADGRDMLREEIVAHPDSEPTLLIDRFSPLRIYDSEIPDLDTLEIQTCSSIDLLISTPRGQESRAAHFHRDGNRILTINGSDVDILTRVSRCLRVAINVKSVLDQMQKRAQSELRLAIQAEDDLTSKLVLAVGVDTLRTRLPKTAIDDLEKAKCAPLGGAELAKLALAVHGFHILSELKRELSDRGLEPPKAWAGSREARKFVESLGFPPEYAGFPGANLSSTLDVDGPVDLKPLHDFQARVVERIQALLTLPRTEKRGMVTLPTGAGKTRVAVEAVVRLAAEKRMNGPVVWIGQTEELCEQAVQAWAYVWRAIGKGPLAVSRFWSGNEVGEAGPGSYQVIVATIDKLYMAREKPQYEWLKQATLIIVDEAHTSIAPMYTDVFRWLGEESITTRMVKPLLGLTATAYRGVSLSETERLIRRYGANKLDDGVFGDEEPYAFLQQRRVLARVRQQELAGTHIPSTAEVERHVRQFGTLPAMVENALGQNSERNKVILDSIRHQPEDGTILLFASSVDHARAMAAELSYYEIPARPISGGTDPALRRRYIEQFRDGEIRVLTNYNVLTQGFDAPEVRAVYVTRPTFSPNLYQQMIGRGLRGRLNGGSDEVLIVNIADNLEQYGDKLAFHHFDYLWRQDDGREPSGA